MRPTISSRRRSQSFEVEKRPAFFILRQPPLLISRDPPKYKRVERLHISRPMQIAPPLDAPHLKSMPTPQPVVAVAPHAWIQVADHVVGRHPLGKPLITRVATQAEINLISGHVHIPWAYPHVKKAQPVPVPVKVKKPPTIYAPLSIVPSLALEDVGNTHDLPIWRAVNNNAKLFKAKSIRHTRGKENIHSTSTCIL